MLLGWAREPGSRGPEQGTGVKMHQMKGTSEVQTLGRCQVGAEGKPLTIREQRERASQWGSGR